MRQTERMETKERMHSPGGRSIPGAFCLLVESLEEEHGGPPPGAEALPALAVPTSGVVALAPAADGLGWALEPAPVRCSKGVHLETTLVDQRPALLLSAPPGARLRRNGGPSSVVDRLEVGDQLRWGRSLFHVTFLRRPQVGPPPAALIGVPCPVCGLPVEPEAVVHVHDCGAPLHLMPGGDEDDPLECALLGCTACGGSVVLEPGYAWLPER